jgi:hypothetical protein
MSLVAGLCNQNIDYVKSIVRTVHGDTTATVVYKDVPCRWQEATNKLIAIGAVTKEYSVEVWLTPDYDIKETYEIKKGTETYKIVNLSKKYDLAGKHDHTKLLLK